VIQLDALASAFLIILPSELPDKTFIATLVLATRYSRLWVWVGVGLAFALQTTIAVLAGGLLTLLPQVLVLGITATLFVIGAFVLFRGGLRSRAVALAAADEERAEVLERTRAVTHGWQAVGIAFTIIFLAEWGDLSQILTAGLAARTADPLSVGIGAWLALLTISGAAVLAGGWLQQKVPLWRVRLVSGALLSALALWTVWELFRL
jgi:putative Ca2+/H+ antiporter (TMEM165/GDT1 family)